jgi:hypothetical protein
MVPTYTTRGRTVPPYTNVNKSLVKACARPPVAVATWPTLVRPTKGGQLPLLFLLWSEMTTYVDTERGGRLMGILEVDLQLLTPAERRDLANALLRAAWSATLAQTRILLLDLLIEVDDAAIGGTA